MRENLFHKIGLKLKSLFSFVPNGKLIFFPNKQYMNECFNQWKEKDIFNETLLKEVEDKGQRE